MSTPIAWPEAQRICDIPEVREALDKFAADAHEENMLTMVSAIMGHASAQGRAAGLEEAGQDLHSIIQGISDGEWEELAVALCEDEGHEPYELLWTRGVVPEPWGDRWCKYEDDAKKMIAMVRKYSTISPTSSDAGKDDARDAALEKIIDMLDKFGMLKYRAGCSNEKTGLELLEQAHAYRHMIHEALAAIPKKEAPDKLRGLLEECSATLKMWADVAPAVSLIKDIDAALSSLEVIGKGEK